MLFTNNVRTMLNNLEANNANLSKVLCFIQCFFLSQLKYIDGTDGYFLDYFENVWNLYVLVTTANSPDIM